MRILWFTHVPLPAVCRRSIRDTRGFGGQWIGSLCARVVQQDGLQLGVACAFPGLADEVFETEGVRYFTVGQPKRFSAFRHRPQDLRRCVEIVNEFCPDLIHIHGTERFYGLLAAANLADKPVVISLQGILGPYAEYQNFFGDLSPSQIVQSTRMAELPMRLGLMWSYADMRRAAKREAKIIRGVTHYMGRTDWDRAQIRALHPAANYFHVGEILREEFYGPRWNVETCARHTLLHVNAGRPRRGTETLIRALRIVQRDFPNVRLRIVGSISERSGYGRFLRRYIAEHQVDNCVELTGYLSADRIVSELLRAHVFVIPSHIENSPNSLAEAMLLGMPCVTSFVGGTPSMVQHGYSGLFFPAGDAAALADSIRQIFEDDALATRLGDGAHAVATERHDPDRVVNQLMKAYRSIVEKAV